MKPVKPVVIKIAETRVDANGVRLMLETLGVSRDTIDKYLSMPEGAETLIELAGRLCYESYELGLNPNVTRIRKESKEYFENILRRGDGSIQEHGTCSFALLNVSRILTHELARHRVGIALSQESLRYVRPKELRFWLPDELTAGQKKAMAEAVEGSEAAYHDLEGKIPWEKLSMDEKKRITSALRRILPDGLATHVVWTANHRTLRWLIEMRTDPAAEVEIRMVFDQIAQILVRDYPLIYQDFVRKDLADGTGSWVPTLRSKV